MKTINTALLDARFDAGLSIKGAARALGIRRGERLGLYERGRRLPTLEHALLLEILYQRPVAFLFPELYARLKERVFGGHSARHPRARTARGGAR